MLSKAEVISLCKGTHGDPFALLGLHTDSKNRLYLRSLQPGALSVSAVDAETLADLARLTYRRVWHPGTIAISVRLHHRCIVSISISKIWKSSRVLFLVIRPILAIP